MKKIIILAAILLTGVILEAQPVYTGNKSSTQLVMIDLQNTVSIIIGLGYGNDADLINVRTNDSSFIVKSNRPWAITVNSEEDVNPTEDNVDAGSYPIAVVYTATRL